MKIKDEEYNKILIIEDEDRVYFRIILKNYHIILYLKLIVLFIIYSFRIYIFIEFINYEPSQKNKCKDMNDNNNFLTIKDNDALVKLFEKNEKNRKSKYIIFFDDLLDSKREQLD